MSEFSEAVERGLAGMTGISSGTCPGCAECMEIDGHSDEQEHKLAWNTSDLPSASGSFSWRPCGVCGTTLGGDRNVWHWIDERDASREIHHEHDMCDDCALFLASGEEPEHWKR